MFGHYLPNKNEGATVDPKSKFRELHKGLVSHIFRRLELRTWIFRFNLGFWISEPWAAAKCLSWQAKLRSQLFLLVLSLVFSPGEGYDHVLLTDALRSPASNS